MKRKNNKARKKIFRMNLSTILCLTMVAVFAAGCGFRKQGSGNVIDSDAQSSVQPDETEKIERNTDFIETGEERDETAFISDRSDSFSVDITAANVIVVEADTNLVLYRKNSSDRIAPASTAKIIMALTALDVCSAEDCVTVGSEIMMMHDDSSRAWLNQGDTPYALT